MVTLQSPAQTWQGKVYKLLTLIGWVLILIAFIVGAFNLAPLASDYFGSNDKAARDSAAAGSDLLGDLETLQVIPRWLLPLTFLGVASFMVGIALEFSMIPDLLDNRAEVMKACFPLIVKKGK